MKHAHHCIALMTGVSVSAFCLAAPALAATNPGIDHTVTAANVSDALTICLDGGSCNYGVSASGAGSVSATVSNAASGELRQLGTATGVATGGDVTLHMINKGDASINAAATASAAGGAASAFAFISPAIAQTGVGQGDVLIDFANNGTLAIDAAAHADGTDALAAATVYTAIHQFAESTGTGNAVADIVNNGALAIDASAVANAATTALAVANVYHGVGNFVAANGSGDAFGSIVNAGSLAVGAVASAALQGTGGNAGALAFVGNAVQQTGFAQAGDVSVNIDNSGTIAITADAFVSALATGPIAGSTGLHATAHAVNSYAIDQTASASAGDVTLGFENSGTIDVAVEATAVAALGTGGTQAGSASANAYLHVALFQHGYAQAGDLVIDGSNDGTFDVAAVAVATGANAIANGHVEFAISQSASAVAGDALVGFTNSGTIDQTVGAVANGTHGSASASAILTQALFQRAIASGDAVATLDNSGSISVGALASADAGQFAYAAVHVVQGIAQMAQAPSTDQVSLANDGSVTIDGSAVASAHNDTASSAVAVASGFVGGVYQSAANKIHNSSWGTTSGNSFLHYTSMPAGVASVTLENSGTLTIFGAAHATADDVAVAMAAASAVIQRAIGSEASVSLDNSGTISAVAVAGAAAGRNATAAAFASGINQFANADGVQISASQTAGGAGHIQIFAGGIGPASASLTNSGAIALGAEAQATGEGFAAATAVIPFVVNQGAFGSQASGALVNDGTLQAVVMATAMGVQTAFARADVDGIAQAAIASGTAVSINFVGSSGTVVGGRIFQGPATAQLSNSGIYDLAAVVNASAEGTARIAIHEHGADQVARGKTASLLIDNSGAFELSAVGNVSAGSATAFIFASGVDQRAMGLDAANASVLNSGTLKIDSWAHGSALTGNATIVAIAAGIEQDPVSLGTAIANVDNSGLLEISAVADATAAKVAFAAAIAGGIHQDPLFGTLDAELENSGRIKVAAAANAVGGTAAYGTANAVAYLVNAANDVADVVNSGSITAVASVLASGPAGSAHAFAAAISMLAANYGTSHAAGSIAGTVVNDGDIRVLAKVDAGNGTTLGATATGIYLSSTRNNATIVNSGTIEVEAVTANGGPANAWGVNVTTGASGDPAASGDQFTFTNDGGTIVARQSTNGGASWQRGMAIDVSSAPNASVINLIGNGTIYGDIAVQAGDQIDVKSGTTYFNGIINPAFVPANGSGAAALDSGLAGVGTLNIEDGGNLVLADPRITGNPAMYDGPAYALVDTLNVGSDGTLTFELQPQAGGAQAPGTYPQVFADTANLDGTLIANITPVGGLFADNYSWQNAIDANARNGRFAACAVGGTYANSLLLGDLICTYDSNDNVDLSISRLAFNSVAGLNGNGASVGTGLECIYDTGLTGGAANMFADLFLIADQSKYNTALNQLSGSAYANYLQSFPALGVHYNDLLDHTTDCQVAAPAGSVLECRGSSPIHVWGQLDYQMSEADGDNEAGTNRSRRSTGLLGVDANVGQQAILGIAAGHVTNHTRDNQFGDDVKADGMQVGAYGVYDPGPFYLKAMTTYSWYNGDSERQINFAGLAPGATFAGRTNGHPDVNMWTFGVHGGYRLALGGNALLTPYLDYDYVDAKLKGFTESGLDGADLTLEESSSKHSVVTGGVKWTTQVGGVVPEATLGYRYRSGGRSSDVRAAFAGDPDCDFDIASASHKRGSVLAGLSIGGRLGPVDLRIGYEGEYNGDITSHSGNFKLVLPLGGHAAPPPRVEVAPPPVEVAPPPPPASVEPAPSPAPPAPVERGERG